MRMQAGAVSMEFAALQPGLAEDEWKSLED
jgi:hypothetical protein